LAKWAGAASAWRLKPFNRPKERKFVSHFTTIKTEIKDIEALRCAVEELGLRLETKTEARGYAGNKLPGEHVIRLKGPYDVAINRQENGSYGLTCDWWNGHAAREVGEKFGKLLQLYGVHKASREARRKGHLVQRRAQPNGSIKLIIMAAT
jgi:hypothetical protein